MMRCIRGALTAVVAAWLAVALSLGPSPAFAAAPNYQGLWWNAPAGSESGWGINFAHQGDIIFASWFTYDTAGKPWWLIAELHKSAPGVYAGGISTVTGPPFNAVPFSPGSVVETAVGTATVTFADGFTATFEYTVNVAGAAKAAVTQTKAITRQLFASPAPICVWGDSQSAATANNFQGLWWNSPPGSEAGWGINFSHQGNIVFATWFTYAANGKPLWLIALLQQTSPGVYAGEVSTVTGPPFNAVPFPPSAVETVVGTATVTFADASNATFSYTVNGIAQTKTITRQVFAAPGTVCHTPVAEATAVGTPDGPAVTGTIGPAGGSLTSNDGRITLTIPPGALAANVQFSIQPITNRAPGGIGAAYRLLPDGQTFAVPAQIAFKYDEQDLAGSAPEALGIAFQDSLQAWQALKYVDVNTLQSTVVGATSHLSDWSLIRTFRLVPAEAHVDAGEPRALSLDFCRPLDFGGITNGVSKCAPESGDFLVTGWAVNGVPGGNATIGTVVATGDYSARYVAPAIQPSPNVVAVSGRLVGASQQSLLVSNITIDKGSWSGASSTSTTLVPLTGFALVKWTAEETSNSITTYRASGTVGATLAGCQISPNSVPIDPAFSYLSINYGNDPPTFDGFGAQTWNVTFTCGDDDPIPGPIAVIWFDAAGVTTNGGSKIAGSGASRDGIWQMNWTFSRDE